MTAHNEINLDNLDDADFDGNIDDMRAAIEEYKLNREQRRAIDKQRTVIPADAPKPQDHLPPQPARTVVQVEAEDADGIKLIPIEYDGHTYRIPADPDDWPGMALYYFEVDKAFSALKELLEGDGWNYLSSKGYRSRQYKEVFELVADAMGFQTAGN